ncbi:MAG: glycerol-3-phosphate 1-O-acyltransferase PlsY [Clostridia bacterium]|nr:glycerol-3-phosphate 1-O-acyltransferase PlsY [Clostridia bacterium]
MFSLNYGGLFAAICGSHTDVVLDNVVLFFAFLLLSIAAGYLLGSVNTAIVISKVFYRDDIRKYGSGNAGMTNMLRTFGGKAAIGVLVGDMLKTVLAIFIGGVLFGFGYINAFSMGYNSDYMMYMGIGTYTAGLAAVLGHIFPVYYGFRGGKGVLVSATMALMLSPILFLIMFAVFVLIVATTKYVSLGSVTSAILYPILVHGFFRMYQMTAPPTILLVTILVACIIVFAHKENLKRISNRTERQLSFKKKEKEQRDADAE